MQGRIQKQTCRLVVEGNICAHLVRRVDVLTARAHVEAQTRSRFSASLKVERGSEDSGVGNRGAGLAEGGAQPRVGSDHREIIVFARRRQNSNHLFTRLLRRIRLKIPARIQGKIGVFERKANPVLRRI